MTMMMYVYCRQLSWIKEGLGWLKQTFVSCRQLNWEEKRVYLVSDLVADNVGIDTDGYE